MSFSAAKRVFRCVRSAATWYVAEPSEDHLRRLRRYEIDLVLRVLPAEQAILELGAGPGWQARVLAEHGHRVTAIDVPADQRESERAWPVIHYDGHRMPFADDSFDVVFSSNVLPHIPHLATFQRELHRVLRPRGMAIHVLPTPAWRMWSSLTHVVKWWMPPMRLGEHANGAFDELFCFSRRRWSRFFADTGWRVTGWHSTELFYTGDSIMDSRIGIHGRRRLATLIGSACNIAVLAHAKGGDVC